MSEPCIESSESSSVHKAVQELPNHKVTGESTRCDLLYLIVTWEEPVTKTERITAVTDLPSGVTKNDFTLRVMEDGMALEIIVMWPNPMINLEVLHQKWLQLSQEDSTRTFSMYHPTVLGLEDDLKRRTARENSKVISIVYIPLPFPVQTQTDEKSDLHFKASGAKIAYVELKGLAESYAIVNDEEEFEEILFLKLMK